MNISAIFEKVTPASLSGDVIVLTVIALGLSWYIWYHGIKQILVLALSVYVASGVASAFPWKVGSVGNLGGAIVLFWVAVVGTFALLQSSPVGKTLSTSKKSLPTNILFGVSVVGLILAQFVSYSALGNGPVGTFLERSLFATPGMRIVWIILPLIFLPFLKPSLKK